MFRRPLRKDRLLLLAVWSLSAFYLARYLNHGWFPHDEGTLGQAAERVLHGEMPNRDFVDPYTGGLAYIDGAIFRIFGVNLLWLRFFLFAVFLAWVPAVFALAREFCSPWPAAGLTLVAVSWSVPNYPAAMPSWFSLFLATFGTLCLARYIRSPRWQWLALAGLCGGVSFLIKSVAVYFVAAAIIFFLYREQVLARSGDGAPIRTPGYLAFLTAGLSLFVAGLAELVLPIAGVAEFLHFVFPGVLVAFILILRERAPANIPTLARFRLFFSMCAAFLLAFALTLSAYFAIYWYHRGLSKLILTIFAAPMSRIIYARELPLDLILQLFPVMAVILFLGASSLRGSPRIVMAVFLSMFAVAFVVGSKFNLLVYGGALASAQGLIPVIVPFAAYILITQSRGGEHADNDNQLMALLLSVTVLFSLIQFPFAHLVYFGYTAPFVVLLTGELIGRIRPTPKLLSTVACCAYIAFAVFLLRDRFLKSRTRPDSDSTRFEVARAGPFWVAKEDSATYQELIPFVQKLAGKNSILAGPDCPEVYFFTGLENRSSALFDFLHDPREYAREMESLMAAPDAPKVVVLNNHPHFSPEELFILRGLVATRFQHSRAIGNLTIYW